MAQFLDGRPDAVANIEGTLRKRPARGKWRNGKNNAISASCAHRDRTVVLAKRPL